MNFILTKLKLVFVRIFVGFIFNKDKRVYVRHKYYVKIKKKYLSRYLYALNKKDQFQDNLPIQNNKLWVCWLQGEDKAPDIVKVCIKNLKNFIPKNMELVILDDNNINNYIKFPDYIYKKRKEGKISNIHYSDILRVCLLAKHGGIWIDATTLLTSEIPNNIINSDFFAFHSQERSKHNNSWFLYSKHNNHILMISMKKLLLEYWAHENKLLDYFTYHLFFDLMIENDIILAKEWDKVPIYWDHDCYLLGKELFQKYNKENFDNITKHFIHKLTYKYNKNISIKGTNLEKILSM